MKMVPIRVAMVMMFLQAIETLTKKEVMDKEILKGKVL